MNGRRTFSEVAIEAGLSDVGHRNRAIGRGNPNRIEGLVLDHLVNALLADFQRLRCGYRRRPDEFEQSIIEAVFKTRFGPVFQ